MRVTILNVEYANLKNKSICQIGLLSKDLDNKKAKLSKVNYYVDPEDSFDKNCIRMHGITQEKVEGAKKFPEVWTEIKDYFVDAIIVGHNIAYTDLDALTKTLHRYSIDIPELYYLCTYELAKKVVPRVFVDDYSLMTLCRFFGIKTPKKQDAFYKVCACADLFEMLQDEYAISIKDEIQRYNTEETKAFVDYVTNATLKKDIHTLYGIVCGCSLDKVLTDDEVDYIRQWKNDHLKYVSHRDILNIVAVIDNILKDDVITTEELETLKSVITNYLDVVSTSAVVLSTHVLQGIIGGMMVDDEITKKECDELNKWLYKNSYLAGRPHFDSLVVVLQKILADGVITSEEEVEIKGLIDEILNPIDALKDKVLNLAGKRIYLSSKFNAVNKSAVEQYIADQGGIIDDGLHSNTDIVLVNNGRYLSRSLTEDERQALNFNENGANIKIMKVSDVVKMKTFNETLFMFMKDRKMKASEVYGKAQMTKQMMSKIRKSDYKNSRYYGYRPKMENICAFALALELTLDETNELLASAGYMFRNIEFDNIIQEAIMQKQYNISVVKEILYAHNIKWIIQK